MDKITRVIPNKPFWDFNLKQVWDYKHLIYYLVHRDMILLYKQTIMGPIHLFLRPFVMSVVFQQVFNRMVGVQTDGIPSFMFYFLNNSVWMYFSQTFTQVGGVFNNGMALLEKVYFPRLMLPFSFLFGNLIKLFIQFVFLVGITAWYWWKWSFWGISLNLLFLPLAVLQTAMISMGFGFLFSIITLKYRDLKNFSATLVQGLLYLSPVIYPVSKIPQEILHLAAFNPLFSNLELYRYAVFGVGSTDFYMHAVGWSVTLLVFFIGVFSFNKIQRKFIDIV